MNDPDDPLHLTTSTCLSIYALVAHDGQPSTDVTYTYLPDVNLLPTHLQISLPTRHGDTDDSLALMNPHDIYDLWPSERGSKRHDDALSSLEAGIDGMNRCE